MKDYYFSSLLVDYLQSREQVDVKCSKCEFYSDGKCTRYEDKTIPVNSCRFFITPKEYESVYDGVCKGDLSKYEGYDRYFFECMKYRLAHRYSTCNDCMYKRDNSCIAYDGDIPKDIRTNGSCRHYISNNFKEEVLDKIPSLNRFD